MHFVGKGFRRFQPSIGNGAHERDPAARAVSFQFSGVVSGAGGQTEAAVHALLHDGIIQILQMRVDDVQEGFYSFASGGGASSVARLLSFSRNRIACQKRKPTPDKANRAMTVPWRISMSFSLPTPFNANANAPPLARLSNTLSAANQARPLRLPAVLPVLASLNTTRQNNHENAMPARNATPLPTENSHFKSGVTCFTENKNAAISPRLTALENRMTRNRSRSSRSTDLASCFTLPSQSAP